MVRLAVQSEKESGMKNSKYIPNSRNTSRAGFTLIEILVAITILAVLIGLLVPAIGGARRTARIAEVKADISRIGSAITAFKLQFGVEPPSSITLCEEADDWTFNADTKRSRAELRKIFPDFTFVDTDFNNDGVITRVTATPSGMTLSGAECLVFFLGGIRSTSSGALDSFSTNPVAPFGSGGSRFDAFYDFGTSGGVAGKTVAASQTWSGRLVDLNNNGFPELLDTIPGQLKPYLYFSTYGGRSYRTTSGDPAHPAITVTPAWYNPDNYSSSTPTNGMPYPYYRVWDSSASTKSDPYNKKTYQLISAGFDYAYGVGGAFTPDTSSNLSLEDRDNIVDFHSGLLGN